MSDGAAPSPKKKKVAAKKPAEHPKYIEMIVAAITALKEKKGSSRQAISKYIVANYKVNSDNVATHLKMALKRGVVNGKLSQVKGVGASGSFKVTKVEAPKKVKKVVKKATPAKKKPATPAKKKPVAKKVTSAKKSTKKTTTAKKVVKKTATKKTAKKPATKKTAAKKPAAKKAVKKTPKKKPATKKTAKK